MPGENKSAEGMEKIEGLIAKMDTHADPAVRAGMRELVKCLMEFYGASLERMLELVWESDRGTILMEEFARDKAISPALLLHGLHPIDLNTRVLTALEKVRPYLRSHGGNVELLNVNDSGEVYLRLDGSCNGCPSSAMTLKLAIEEAIYDAAPDITALNVEGVVEQKLPPRPMSIRGPEEPERLQQGWKDVDGLESLDQGSIRTLDVSGQPVLFCRIAETYYAYSNKCPHCTETLQGTHLAETTVLICSACGQKYDALRAGRGLDRPALHLQPFPLLMEQGRTRIALPAS